MTGMHFSRSSPNRRRLEHALARVHPVHVAAQRVDLAVVRDQPVGMRALPAREGVGREARVHQRQRRLDAVVAQVGIELRQLVAVEHPLVDDGARRQAGDVEVRLLGDVQPPHGVPRAPPDHVKLALERVVVGDVGAAADEELLDDRLRSLRGLAEHAVVGRHLAPAEEGLPLVAHDLLEQVLAGGPAARVVRQEHHADAVLPGGGQLDAHGRARLAKNRCGICIRMPAPSPVFFSQPHAPRCSRFSRISSPFLTMLEDFRPLRSTTKPTPQASCSWRGS